MKYLPLREIDTVSNALNFSTPDCHVIGGCDIYTTKAAKSDKKLYRNIESSLESQYESLVRLSASLSPPYRTASDDGNGDDKHGRKRREHTVEAPEIDLSRASPFGPLSKVTARRTFAYLIATLNASHPDYDFSHTLRPRDFRKERSLRTMKHNIDSTLQNLRPRQTAALNMLSPPTLAHPTPAVSGLANEVWNPNMWKLIEKEMTLRDCERYRYTPDEDPFDGEEGAIWSMHYFFFNKERKRVCYLYLRAFSVISHSPIHAPVAVPRSKRTSFSLSVGEGANKRASFWLSNDLLQRGIDAASYGDDDDMEYFSRDDDEIDVPAMNLDDIRSGIVDGTFGFDDEYGYGDVYDDDEYDDDSWKYGRHVRGISEEIGEVMELDG